MTGGMLSTLITHYRPSSSPLSLLFLITFLHLQVLPCLIMSFLLLFALPSFPCISLITLSSHSSSSSSPLSRSTPQSLPHPLFSFTPSCGNPSSSIYRETVHFLPLHYTTPHSTCFDSTLFHTTLCTPSILKILLFHTLHLSSPSSLSINQSSLIITYHTPHHTPRHIILCYCTLFCSFFVCFILLCVCLIEGSQPVSQSVTIHPSIYLTLADSIE